MRSPTEQVERPTVLVEKRTSSEKGSDTLESKSSAEKDPIEFEIGEKKPPRQRKNN